MSHVHEGPLATYTSLTDGHLAGYFANNRMRRHLHKAGLVSKRGEIVSESTYRLNMSRREHKKHVKDMLAQAIVHKTLDVERSRQAEIKKKLEEIAKIQLVRRVRASTSKKGDEDILPLLTPRGSPCHSPASKGRGHRSKPRPNDMQGVRRGGASRMSDMSFEEEGDVLYLDDEGRPITPAYSDRPPRYTADPNNIDTRQLHSLDTVALRKYALLMAQMEEGRGLTSPYMMPQVPLPPRPPSGSARTPRSGRRRVQSASSRRTITTDSRLARLHRPETAKSHVGDQQTLCRVTMKYHGWNLHLARERTDNTQEVVVEQQHCGGNTLTVFKERLDPGTKFEFISYRHRGYPFSLSLYVDGQMDSRVSTCCEYRHSRGAKIGGKQGHFSLLRVSGAVPCYKCQVAKGVLVPRKASPKKLKRPAEVRREEVIVVSTRRDKEREGAEDDGTQDRSEPAEDDYAEDFDDSQASEATKSTASSSSSSSSSSESESESETELSTPKEEGKKAKSSEKEKEKEEVFQPREDRGEDREEKEDEQEEEHSPRDRGSERQTSARSPRVEVNGTGRQIDDYSSDDEDDKKTKVVSVEDVDGVDNAPIKSRRRSASSSSSSSSSSSEDDDRAESSREPRGPPVINVDLLDKEEKKEEEALQERKRRDEIRQKEEQDLFQRQQSERERRTEERKKAEEARRQEDLLRQQRRDEERRKRDEERRLEAERERQRREEEEESRRRAAQTEEDPETRERERLRSQKLRDEQIRQEQLLREEKRRQFEQEREETWKRQEALRAAQRQKEAEEREKRRQEEGSSSARTESSTAQSTTASSASSSESSSEESTPRHVPAKPLTAEREDSEIARAASPLPPPATYEDRGRLREPREDDHTAKRPASPLPAAAVYEPRRRQQREREREASPARSVSPFPPPAVYEDRRRARRSENERIPDAAEYALPPKEASPSSVPQIRLEAASGKEEEEDDGDKQPATGRTSTTEASTTGTGESSSEEDTTGEESQEEVDEAPQKSKDVGRYHTEELSSEGGKDPLQQKTVESYPGDHSSDEEDGGRSRKRQGGPTSVVDTQESTLAQPEQRRPVYGRYEGSGTADSSSDSATSSDDDNAGSNIDDRTATDQKKHSTTVTSGQHATSESDGENMHGGADPDNVAEQEEAGELHPLRTRELPVAKAHKGEIMDLVSEGKDSLDLSNVLLNKTQVFQLASHVEESSSVKMITLCNTGLDDDDLQRLSEALCASPSEPVMLNLSLNSISQHGVQHVLQVLKAKPSIKMLILQGNPIGDEGAKKLTEGLQDLHRVARVNRKALQTTDTTTTSISDTASVDSSSSSIDPAAMAQRYLLQELDLTDTSLSDEGASHLAQMVAGNVYVENVNLSHNPRITADKGWKQIGEALARNRCIRTLTLDGNKIGDEGLGHIARGLQNNRVLHSLALEDAGLGAQGGKSLMDMLKRNTTILELTLSPGNSIPEELEEDIGKYIALNRAPYNNFHL